MLESEFMRLAFATGAVVGLLAPAVGFFLVQRNMSLVGDGVGHTAFAGVAAGYLLGVEPVLTALVAAVAGAVGIEWLRSCSPRLRARWTSTSSRSSSARSSRSPAAILCW
jgi:zinc transport system permease protein